jgi:hypothetical protein
MPSVLRISTPNICLQVHKQALTHLRPATRCLMPYALCLMPYICLIYACRCKRSRLLLHLPYALCLMPYALRLSTLSICLQVREEPLAHLRSATRCARCLVPYVLCLLSYVLCLIYACRCTSKRWHTYGQPRAALAFRYSSVRCASAFAVVKRQ